MQSVLGADSVCASEGGNCSCQGTVTYGKRYVAKKPGPTTSSVLQMGSATKEKSASGIITCDSTNMGGDPIFGYDKHCICTPSLSSVTRCHAGNLTASECVMDSRFDVSGVPGSWICTGVGINLTLGVPAGGPKGKGLTFEVLLRHDNATTQRWGPITTTTQAHVEVPASLLDGRSHGHGEHRHELFTLEVFARDLLVTRPNQFQTKHYASANFSQLVYRITPPIEIELPQSLSTAKPSTGITVHAYDETHFTTRSQSWLHQGCLLPASLAALHPKTYHWTIRDISGFTHTTLNHTSSSSAFSMPKFALSPLHKYEVSLITGYKDLPFSEHVHTLSLSVLSAPLSVSIREGNNNFTIPFNPAQPSLTLNTATVDRDNAVKTYVWNVTDTNAQLILKGSLPALTLFSTNLTAEGAPYRVTVEVSKFLHDHPAQKASASTSIGFTKTMVPIVTITSDGTVVNPGSMISLQSTATLLGAPCVGCKYAWTSPHKSQLPAYEGTATCCITIPASSFAAGNYLFQLTVMSPAGQKGVTQVEITVNSPPLRWHPPY